MATQAQLDAAEALLMQGDFDAFNALMREPWPGLWTHFAQELLNSAERVRKVALSDGDGPVGILFWQNPFGIAILVRLVLDVTTPATAALTADFGQTGTVPMPISDNLIDGVNLGASAGVFSSIDDDGTNGRTYRRVDVNEHVIGATDLGAAAGLVGNAFIFYRAA